VFREAIVVEIRVECVDNVDALWDDQPE